MRREAISHRLGKIRLWMLYECGTLIHPPLKCRAIDNAARQSVDPI